MNARPSSSFSNCPILTSHAICWRAMSQPTLATPPCAAQCSRRIDLVPSPLAAVLWFAWLTLVCGVTLFAVALPYSVRLVLCIAVVAPGIRSVRSFVLLEGSNAVRSIEWSEEGEFLVRLGPRFLPQPASLAAGSFRLGVRVWVLRFVTPSGTHPVLIAGGIQDVRAFRRLSRCLNTRMRRASGRGSRPAVTIQPKV